MKKAVAFVCLVAAVFMVTCAKNDNPTGPGGGGGDNIMTLTYSVSGNTMIVTSPLKIVSNTRCDSTSLVTSYDTISTPSVDTMTYQLFNNDMLLVTNGSDTLTRIGTGSGIQGQWDKGGATVQIGAGVITVDISSKTPADDFMNYEWSFMSSLENITAVKTSSTSVKLTGNKSSEVVTITWNSAGDATYTSSVAANTPGTVFAKPTKCPNADPAWFETFLGANSSLVKKAVSTPSTISHGLFTLFAKKPAH